MSNKTITTNKITPNTLFFIRGKVGFCRIASRVEGEELEKDIERRRSRGWNAIEKPYTTITIHDAQVLVRDQQNPSLAERYAMESLYVNKDGITSYTANSKSPVSLPYVAVAHTDNPMVVDQVKPEGELANGLDVTLVMRVFKSARNNGVGLDGVIVNEPVRYFTGIGASGSDLDKYGITFNPLKDADDIAPAQPAQQPAVPAQPAQPAYAQPTASPFATTQQPAAPAAPQQPAVAQMPVSPMSNPMGFAPVSPMTPAQPDGGIRYDPNQPGDENRGY